jgi:hypothetical protein
MRAFGYVTAVVIFVVALGVGLLAMTTNPGLKAAPAGFARCALAAGHDVGPSSGQFLAAFPGRVVSTPTYQNGVCAYENAPATRSGGRFLFLSVLVYQFNLMGPLGSRVYKIRTSGPLVTPLRVGGAAGAYSEGCPPGANVCRGLLEVANGHEEWLISAFGDGNTRTAITAFFRSFRPQA